MRILAIVAMWAAMFAAKPGAPDFSGTWHYNPDKTTAHRMWTGDTRLVVRQWGQQISFDYYSGGEQFGHEFYITDGKERKQYENKQEAAFARARWVKEQLQLTTRHVYSTESAQYWEDVDRWLLADDGRTLVNLLSDGKKVVFDKDTGKAH